MNYFDKILLIYKRNKIIFFKKIFFKIIKIIYSLPFFPISLALFILIILISPFIKIRVAELPTSRIGHFTKNVDLYLSYKKYFQKEKTIDIFFPEKIISNQYLYKIYKKKMIIVNKLFFNQIYLMINFFNAHNHKILSIESDRDILNIHSNTRIEKNIKLSLEEDNFGYSILKKLGITKKDKFVCLVVRDDNFLKKLFPDDDFSYHNYRDSDITNYCLAAENITKRGYYVLRMGSMNKKKLISDNKKIIDYSFSNFRSDFMDIFLSSKCSFAISNSSGVDALFKLFRKPIVWVNFVPVALLPTFRSDYIYLFKKHFSIKLRRELNLNEIFEHGVAGAIFTKIFEEKKIKLIENSPQEISDAVLELDDLINKKIFYNKNKYQKNKLFWKIYKKKLFKYNFRHLHGKLLGRYSSKFLLNNKKFLT